MLYAQRGEMADPYIIVIDTETTGLPQHEWAAITSFSAVTLDSGLDVVGIESMDIRPDVLDERALPALSIQNRTLADIEAHLHTNADLMALIADMQSRWSTEDTPSVWTAYNLPFDKEMLRRSGVDVDSLKWGDCCMQTAMKVLGSKRWLKLKVAAEQLGAVVHDTHNATSDALLAAAVLRRCAYRLLGAK